MTALLEVRGLTQHFSARGGTVRAVEDVSFELAEGEVLGLVGESGSGKTTIGQAILRLVDPTAGRILFRGNDITTLPDRELKPFRRQAQPIFQDPFGSLNPRMTIEAIIAEPLVVHGIGRNRQERRQRVLALSSRSASPRDSLDPLSASILGRPAPAHRRSHVRSPPSPRSSSPMSRCRRSTCRSRRRSSIFCANCSSGSSSPCCSSRMTSRSSNIFRTA